MGYGRKKSRVDFSVETLIKDVEISDFKFSKEYEDFKQKLPKEIKKNLKMDYKDSFSKLETLIRKINSYSKKADIELGNMKKRKETEIKKVSIDNEKNLEYLKSRLDSFKESLDRKQRRVDWYLKGLEGYEKEDDEGSDAL